MEDILKQLETKHVDDPSTAAHGDSLSTNVKKLSAPKLQLSIFDAHSQAFDEIRKILEAVDINRLTPVEALLKLQEIKSMVK